jgi:NADH-quinone oxidoreductase subunit L
METPSTFGGIESPITITLPLIVLCVLSVFGGVLGLPSVFHATHLFATYLSSVTEPSKAFLHEHEAISHSAELMLMAFAGIAAIASIWFAYQKYVTKGEQPADEASLTGLNKWISNKFYVDELYDKAVVKPMLVLSDLFMVVVDKLIIDLAVNAIAWFVGLTGRITRLFQTGNTGFYIFAMVLSMVVLFVIRLLA